MNIHATGKSWKFASHAKFAFTNMYHFSCVYKIGTPIEEEEKSNNNSKF